MYSRKTFKLSPTQNRFQHSHVHRWKAKQKIDGDGTIEADFVDVPDGIPHKLYAASLSVRHGDRISPSERKAIAREIVQENPEFNTVTLAENLAVSTSTARAYVGDILAKRRDERASKSGRLASLGWTQQEIADVLGCERSVVSRDLCKIAELRKSTIALTNEGHGIDEIVKRTGLSPTQTTAMILEGKDDVERMATLGINVQPYDVWNFPRCHSTPTRRSHARRPITRPGLVSPHWAWVARSARARTPGQTRRQTQPTTPVPMDALS